MYRVAFSHVYPVHDCSEHSDICSSKLDMHQGKVLPLEQLENRSSEITYLVADFVLHVRVP